MNPFPDRSNVIDVLGVNQETLPSPDDEGYDGASPESRSTTWSIESLFSDNYTIRNPNLSTNLENRIQENHGRRLDEMAENLNMTQERLTVMTEKVSILTDNMERLAENLARQTENQAKQADNLARQTEHYDNLFVKNTENITKMKENFQRIYGRKNGFK